MWNPRGLACPPMWPKWEPKGPKEKWSINSGTEGYGKTTKFRGGRFLFSKKCLGSKLLHLSKTNGWTKKHDGREGGISLLTMGIFDVLGTFVYINLVPCP